MPTIVAKAILDSNTGSRSILAVPTAPAIKGHGNLDVVCGGCGTVLIEHARPYLAIRDIVIRCPNCKQCNDIQ